MCCLDTMCTLLRSLASLRGVRCAVVVRPSELLQRKEMCTLPWSLTSAGCDVQSFALNSVKHRSAPEGKGPWCLSLWGPLGYAPSIGNNKISMGPCEAPKGTNTKVTSAKGGGPYFFVGGAPAPKKIGHLAKAQNLKIIKLQVSAPIRNPHAREGGALRVAGPGPPGAGARRCRRRRPAAGS